MAIIINRPVLDTKQLTKIILGVGFIAALSSIGIVLLVDVVLFVAQIAWQVTLQAMQYADHTDALTHILLILVLGYALYRVANVAPRVVRAFIQW